MAQPPNRRGGGIAPRQANKTILGRSPPIPNQLPPPPVETLNPINPNELQLEETVNDNNKSRFSSYVPTLPPEEPMSLDTSYRLPLDTSYRIPSTPSKPNPSTPSKPNPSAPSKPNPSTPSKQREPHTPSKPNPSTPSKPKPSKIPTTPAGNIVPRNNNPRVMKNSSVYSNNIPIANKKLVINNPNELQLEEIPITNRSANNRECRNEGNENNDDLPTQRLVNIFTRTYKSRLLSLQEQQSLIRTFNLEPNTSNKITFNPIGVVVGHTKYKLDIARYDDTPGSWVIEGKSLFVVIGNPRIPNAAILPLLLNTDTPISLELLIRNSNNHVLDAIIKYLSSPKRVPERVNPFSPVEAARLLAETKILQIIPRTTETKQLSFPAGRSNNSRSNHGNSNASASNNSRPKTNENKSNPAKEGLEAISGIEIVYVGGGKCSIKYVFKDKTSKRGSKSLCETMGLLIHVLEAGFIQYKQRAIFKPRNVPIMIPKKPFSHYGDEEIELGKGTYGRVSLYRNGLKTYAVKTLFGDRLSQEDIARGKVKNGISHDALREASTMLWLNHPNLISVLDISSNINGDITFILPAADKGTLDNLIQVLDPVMIPNYTFQLLQGLKYLADLDIMHRDLKPPNILVYSCSDDPKALRIVISDFGLARSSTCNNVKEDGNILGFGTRPFRPPEALLGNTKYDIQSDIWSMGCIIMQMYIKVSYLFADYGNLGGEGQEGLVKDDAILFMSQVKLVGSPTRATYPEAFTLPYWSDDYLGKNSTLNQTFANYNVPEDMRGLLKRMLVLNPRDRINAYDALETPAMLNVKTTFCNLEAAHDIAGEKRCINPLQRRAVYPTVYFNSPEHNSRRREVLNYIFHFVIIEHRKSPDTAFLAQYIFDFATRSESNDSGSSRGATNNNFDLTALSNVDITNYVTCSIVLASKIKAELEGFITYKHFNLVAPNSIAKVLAMEAIILSKILYIADVVTAYDFVKLYLDSSQEKDLGLYFLALAGLTRLPFLMNPQQLGTQISILAKLTVNYTVGEKLKRPDGLSDLLLTLLLSAIKRPDNHPTLLDALLRLYQLPTNVFLDFLNAIY